MIYLDNNATTAIDPAALDAMLPFLREAWFNASSGYTPARRVKRAVQTAREQVAALLGCAPEEIIFTAGGTEADNTAIHAAIHALPERRHIVTCATEHDAVLNYCAWLERSRGYEVTRLGVDAAGRVDVNELAAAVRPGRTALVTLMWSNNETGVIGPVDEAAAIAGAAGAFFHTDAVQAGGKVPMQLADRGIHFLSLSGHKFHAPKGIGVLYANRRAAFQPWMIGGGQENGRRAGTENVAGIVALGAAAEQARLHLEQHADAATDPVCRLRDRFEAELIRRIPGTTVNGHAAARTPNTASVRFDATEAQGVLILLDQKGICASAGSACATGALHPSHVLSAMGLTPAEARATVRFSLSRFTTEEEIDRTIEATAAAVEKFRSLSGPR